MSPSTSEPSIESARESVLLDDHHRRLERVCTDLLSRTYADDPRALCACWRQFETELLDHMRAEEDVILPAYEQVAPTEALAIRADHARIRDLVQRLGVEVDLHQIRLHTVRELLAALQAHADREDAAMYPWAEGQLPTSRLAVLRARIEHWLEEAQSWFTA
jgi:hemerythrin superfamily protein